jgi:hypothetical protein
MLEGEERDRAAVAETVERVARGADLRQWGAVRAAFADRVELDYGAPEHLTAEEIIARWRPLFAGFDATRHALSDLAVRIDGSRASATSRFEAVHRRRGTPGGDEWTLAGRYEFELARSPDGWRVTRMRMIPERSTGNATLPEAALRASGAG